jgi:hypothetical protein
MARNVRKLILDFWFSRALDNDQTFERVDLHELVNDERRNTPWATIERAIRELRSQGLINYSVDKKTGTYTMLTLRAPAPTVESVPDATGTSEQT